MTVELGMTLWSKTIKVDADGDSSFPAGGYVIDDYVNGDGELTYITVYHRRGQIEYHHIVESDVDGDPEPVNVMFVRSMGQRLRDIAARDRTDRHMDAQFALSRVLAKYQPQKAGR